MSDKIEHHAQQFQALGNPIRLRILRLVVDSGGEGLPAGNIQDQVRMPASSLSHHLKQLVDAGLVTVRFEGTYHIYVPEFRALHALTEYFWEDCCQGGKRKC